MTILILRLSYSIYLAGLLIWILRTLSLLIFENKWERYALFAPLWPLCLFSKTGKAILKNYLFGK